MNWTQILIFSFLIWVDWPLTLSPFLLFLILSIFLRSFFILSFAFSFFFSFNFFLSTLKHSFFQAAIMSILLYGCTTWMLTKRQEKKLGSNYTRMLWAIFNRSWRQHPTKQQLYGHLPPIMETIKIRQTRHAGHCWRSRDELISEVLLWTPSHGQAKAGRPAWSYIQQLCEDMGCSPEDLPESMKDRERWREKVRDICADGMTWWWWSFF